MADTLGTHYSQFIGSIPVQSSPPHEGSELDGMTWYDSDTDQLAVYYNGSWRFVAVMS